MPWPWPPIHREHRVFDRLSDEEAAREVREILRARRWTFASEAIMFGGCAGVFAAAFGTMLAVWLAVGSRSTPGWLFIPPVFIFSIVVGYIAGVWQYAVLSSTALHARLGTAARGERCCSWCLYPLGGLPVDSSGLVVCPECGKPNAVPIQTPAAHPPIEPPPMIPSDPPSKQ